MMGFLTTYVMLIFLAAVVAFIIITYKAPTSLKSSTKEAAQSIVIYVIIFCLFNVATVGTDLSEWRQTYLIPILLVAAAFRLSIDWWMLRQRQNEEAS